MASQTSKYLTVLSLLMLLVALTGASSVAQTALPTVNIPPAALDQAVQSNGQGGDAPPDQGAAAVNSPQQELGNLQNDMRNLMNLMGGNSPPVPGSSPDQNQGQGFGGGQFGGMPFGGMPFGGMQPFVMQPGGMQPGGMQPGGGQFGGMPFGGMQGMPGNGPPFGGPGFGDNNPSPWTVTNTGQGKDSIDLGKYTLDLNKSNQQWTLTNKETGQKTDISGDGDSPGPAPTPATLTPQYSSPLLGPISDGTAIIYDNPTPAPMPSYEHLPPDFGAAVAEASSIDIDWGSGQETRPSLIPETYGHHHGHDHGESTGHGSDSTTGNQAGVTPSKPPGG